MYELIIAVVGGISGALLTEFRNSRKDKKIKKEKTKKARLLLKSDLEKILGQQKAYINTKNKFNETPVFDKWSNIQFQEYKHLLEFLPDDVFETSRDLHYLINALNDRSIQIQQFKNNPNNIEVQGLLYIYEADVNSAIGKANKINDMMINDTKNDH